MTGREASGKGRPEAPGNQAGSEMPRLTGPGPAPLRGVRSQRRWLRQWVSRNSVAEVTAPSLADLLQREVGGGCLHCEGAHVTASKSTSERSQPPPLRRPRPSGRLGGGLGGSPSSELGLHLSPPSPLPSDPEPIVDDLAVTPTWLKSGTSSRPFLVRSGDLLP